MMDHTAGGAHTTRIGIVGGGISGLTLAYRLQKLRPTWQTLVWEGTDRLGGVLHTETGEGYVAEFGADSFLVTSQMPWAAELADELGLVQDLVETAERYRRALVVHRGRLAPLPSGFQLLTPGNLLSILSSPLLSWTGKLRLAWEPFVPRRRSDEDESLASFAQRRLGREAFERIVEPLVAGIYTADAEQLSMAAALPQFFQQELEFGSLTRAAAARRTTGGTTTGARYAQFQTHRDGMQSLALGLAKQLESGTVRCGRAVRSIERQTDGRWTVCFDDNTSHTDLNAVVMATPAQTAAKVMRAVVPSTAAELAGISYADSAVVHLRYDQHQFARPLDAFGFVVPRTERLPILAGSFSSVKFPHRAPAGQEAVRIFLGGATQRAILERDDGSLMKLAHDSFAQLVHLRGVPREQRIVRWEQRMPQYHLGHRSKIERIRQALRGERGLYLVGNYLDGVGIPQCVRTANQAADSIVNDLGNPTDLPPGEPSAAP